MSSKYSNQLSYASMFNGCYYTIVVCKNQYLFETFLHEPFGSDGLYVKNLNIRTIIITVTICDTFLVSRVI